MTIEELKKICIEAVKRHDIHFYLDNTILKKCQLEVVVRMIK